MAEKKSKKQGGTKKALIYLLLVFLIFITIAEGMGYDPVGWVRNKFSGISVHTDDELTVSFIDVGQGDCIFISSGKENMLIDCGESSQSDTVIAYLNDLGVKRLDYVVGTHPHSDHMGGMAAIIQTYDIGEVIMPHLDDSDIPTTRYFEKFLDACSEKSLYITEAELGRTIALGDAEAEFIAPNSEKYNGANNYSIGIILTHGSNDFLFTGDAEKHAEKEMLESGRLEHVRVYKAGHHGSDTSSSEDFLAAVSPEYAVIMCGAGNSYGHPHDEVVERLEEYVKQIYRTDLNGTIVFESDGINLRIRTER